MKSMPDAILIAGPTASGKSAAALALAEQAGGIIVNADSMQVYAEPRILTARPSDEDMARVPHLLYGHASVRDAYSAGRYQADAAQALTRAREMKRVPIFTGGTGLYFGVLTEGLTLVPPIPPEIRAGVEARWKEIGAEAFHAELAERDPISALRYPPSDTQRTLRAYEVFEGTGVALPEWQKSMGKPLLAGMKLARFVIAPPRDELYAGIDARFDRMVEQGAMEEADRIAALSPAPSAAKILGLRELVAAHRGEMSLQAAKEAARTASRQYAKRQITWFRNRMADWTWMEATDKMEVITAIGKTISFTSTISPSPWGSGR
ncbi:MAG TPA: tRNA (adenosine(37)-N6)-dimethylallyltransferase MiaA [Rhizomicrobium sp.]|jgi:tRNA dimethylallyltransferase